MTQPTTRYSPCRPARRPSMACRIALLCGCLLTLPACSTSPAMPAPALSCPYPPASLLHPPTLPSVQGKTWAEALIDARRAAAQCADQLERLDRLLTPE